MENMKGRGGVLRVSWNESGGELKSGNYDQWLVREIEADECHKMFLGVHSLLWFRINAGLDVGLLVRIAKYMLK